MPEKTHQGRNHKSTWTVKDIRFVEQHYGRRSVEEIARRLGRSVGAVRRIAHQSGVGKMRSQPWTEE